MPELPEVEAVARALEPLVRGQTVERCRVIHAIAVRPETPEEFCGQVEGRSVEGVERRGKYLLLRLDRGWLALHFRLDGQLIWRPQGSGHSPAGEVHIDVAFDLASGTLGFVDRRHFGRVRWVAQPEDLPGVRGLGEDALSRGFTARRLKMLLAGSRRPLKLLLTDQGKIAGLGNI